MDDHTEARLEVNPRRRLILQGERLLHGHLINRREVTLNGIRIHQWGVGILIHRGHVALGRILVTSRREFFHELSPGGRNVRQNPVRGGEQLKRLAKLRRAHRPLSELVLHRLGETPEPRRLLAVFRAILAFEKLDVVQCLVDLVLGQSFDLPPETLTKYVVLEA